MFLPANATGIADAWTGVGVTNPTELSEGVHAGVAVVAAAASRPSVVEQGGRLRCFREGFFVLFIVFVTRHVAPLEDDEGPWPCRSES